MRDLSCSRLFQEEVNGLAVNLLEIDFPLGLQKNKKSKNIG